MKLTRRDFIKSGSKTIAILSAGAVSIPFPGKTIAASTGTKSTVIVTRNPNAISNRNVCDPKLVTAMFDKSLAGLTGRKNASDAWGSLGITGKDTVAIKVNCNSWTIHLSPHMELVDALCQSLGHVIPLNRIILYERSTRDLESGGFKRNISGRGVRFFGNDEGGGYDPVERLTRIVTRQATKIINLASMKCVESDFVASLFLKNHIGTLMDSDMPKCHGNLDFLAEVNSRPNIKNKTVLNICDGFRGTYRRGVPWYWAGIVMGKDPVATEYQVIQVMNQKRTKEGIKLLPTPEHLEIAQKKYGLGTCDPAEIKVFRV